MVARAWSMAHTNAAHHSTHASSSPTGLQFFLVHSCADAQHAGPLGQFDRVAGAHEHIDHEHPAGWPPRGGQPEPRGARGEAIKAAGTRHERAACGVLLKGRLAGGRAGLAGPGLRGCDWACPVDRRERGTTTCGITAQRMKSPIAHCSSEE